MAHQNKRLLLIVLLILVICSTYGIVAWQVKLFPFKQTALNKKETLVFNAKSDFQKKDGLEKKIIIDTTHKRFLLVGDSEIEGIRDPFYDYCKKNGHELALAAVWYCATDITYGTNDTLKSMIQKVKPDYIVFVIGLNQIYQKYFEPSGKAIDTILKTIDTIPYLWVGPANWTEDKGINDFYQSRFDSGRFFLSKNLVLDRARDGRHPTNAACRIWMDSIADWMQTKAYWKVRMEKPDSLEKRRNFPNKIMMVGKDLNAPATQPKKATKEVSPASKKDE